MTARFTIPRDIYFGRGAIEQLARLEGSRAVVVTGGSAMQRFGFLEKVLEQLHKAGMQTSVIADVEPDPSVETVMAGARAMREFAPDWIVALGGGSPIDAAKAMWAFYEYPDCTFEQLITPFSFPKLRQRARFAAISSTSGTATEVTAFAVITDYAKGIKYPLADYNITPDVAIVDPELAMTMPKQLTAYTGMDALTHAVEAYVSTMASAFTDPLALSAINTVFDSLPESYGGDEPARERMHYAQCLAGMAFTNALLGIVHSMAHKTGAAFPSGHVPHGCANAIYLPYVIEYNRRTAERRYAEIAHSVGIDGSESECVDRLCDKIREYSHMLGIPASLREFGVPEEEFLSRLSEIAESACEDACTGSNPRPITPKEMERLLRCVYYGEKVEF